MRQRGSDSLLNGGNGNDTMYGAGGKDTMKGGKSKDKLLGGDGNDVLNARNGKKETVDCGKGSKDKATVDRADVVKGCETVARPRT